MSEELKPCPFCQSTDSIEFGKVQDVGSWMVECVAELDGCGAMSGLYESESEAVEAWNRRPPARELSDEEILSIYVANGINPLLFARAIIAAQREDK